MASAVTMIREFPLGAQPPNFGSTLPGGQDITQEQRPNGIMRDLAGWQPGMELFGFPGEQIRIESANVPNAEFFQHAMLILSMVAVNLDLPVQVLMLDATHTNFSGWRGSVDQARQRWKEIQTWLQGSLHRPVYEWKVRQWAVTDPTLRAAVQRVDDLRASLGYVPAGTVDPFAHVWHAQELPYIQPVDDATADILQAKGLLSSPRRLAAMRGIDFADLTAEQVSDYGLRIRSAIDEARAINAEKGLSGDEQIKWREVLSWPMPDGVQVSIGPTAQQQQQAPAKGKPAAGAAPERNDEPGQNRLRSINGNGVLTHGN
jgi:hypothetical protein